MTTNKNRATTIKLHKSPDGVWRRCTSTGARSCYVGGEHKTLVELAASGGGLISIGGKSPRKVSEVENGMFYLSAPDGSGLKYRYTADGERVGYRKKIGETSG